MGGTRCLFDPKKNKKGVDTSQTKSLNKKCNKKNFFELIPIHQNSIQQQKSKWTTIKS